MPLQVAVFEGRVADAARERAEAMALLEARQNDLDSVRDELDKLREQTTAPNR